jgi:hypothetical protein
MFFKKSLPTSMVSDLCLLHSVFEMLFEGQEW